MVETRMLRAHMTLKGVTTKDLADAQGWLIGCGWVVTAVQNGTLTFPAGMEGTVSVFSKKEPFLRKPRVTSYMCR